MDVDELLALDRELTDEEFEFLEQETLKLVKEMHGMLQDLGAEIRQSDETLADKLEVESDMMLLAVEAAAKAK